VEPLYNGHIGTTGLQWNLSIVETLGEHIGTTGLQWNLSIVDTLGLYSGHIRTTGLVVLSTTVKRLKVSESVPSLCRNAPPLPIAKCPDVDHRPAVHVIRGVSNIP
jgi:hypothetical protein